MYSYNKGLYNTYNSLLADHFKALFSEADLYITQWSCCKSRRPFWTFLIVRESEYRTAFIMAYKTGQNAQWALPTERLPKPENTYLYATTNFAYTKATTISLTI